MLTSPSNPLRIAAHAGLAAVILSSPSAAQVPDGHFVCSSLKVITIWPGDSGVFVAHPRDMGTLTPITGLPESITYASDGAPGALGANCVLHDPATGGVIVGTNGRAGETLDLHRITLDGLAAATVDLYPLGLLVANGGGVFELDWIDADEVIAAVGAIAGPAGAPATVQIARVDLNSGVVAPVDLRGFATSGFINALAYDAASDTVYFGVGGFPSGNSEIHAMELGGVAPPALVATLTGAIRNLEIDANGDVVAGLGVAPMSGVPSLVRVTPGGATTALLSTFDNVNALAIEPATGQFGLVGQDDRTDVFRYGAYFFDGDSTSGGAADELAILRDDMDAAGPLSGIDAAPSPVAYGAPSGADGYSWSTAQDPSRLAIAGEQWTAAIDWPAGSDPMFGKYVFSSASSAPAPAGSGFDILVDQKGIFHAGVLGSDEANRRSTIAVDVAPAMKGTTFYAQAFLVQMGGVSATPGLRVRVQ